MLKIETGLEKRPLKVVIYGAEGIGKSTFASQFPNTLFLDTEGGTSSLPVRRVKCGDSWEYLLSCVEEVIKDPSICQTLVVDTADWAESLCSKYVCEKYRKANIEDFGFGKGYVYLVDEFSKLLDDLNKLIEIGLLTPKEKPPRDPARPNAFTPWPDDESARLVQELSGYRDALLALAQIAESHGRSIGSIVLRADKLGLCG